MGAFLLGLAVFAMFISSIRDPSEPIQVAVAQATPDTRVKVDGVTITGDGGATHPLAVKDDGIALSKLDIHNRTACTDGKVIAVHTASSGGLECDTAASGGSFAGVTLRSGSSPPGLDGTGTSESPIGVDYSEVYENVPADLSTEARSTARTRLGVKDPPRGTFVWTGYRFSTDSSIERTGDVHHVSGDYQISPNVGHDSTELQRRLPGSVFRIEQSAEVYAAGGVTAVTVTADGDLRVSGLTGQGVFTNGATLTLSAESVLDSRDTLSRVSLTGAYGDLSGLPTIPTIPDRSGAFTEADEAKLDSLATITSVSPSGKLRSGVLSVPDWVDGKVTVYHPHTTDLVPASAWDRKYVELTAGLNTFNLGEYASPYDGYRFIVVKSTANGKPVSNHGGCSLIGVGSWMEVLRLNGAWEYLCGNGVPTVPETAGNWQLTTSGTGDPTWTAATTGRTNAEIDARVRAGVSDWAEEGNTEVIPSSKLPATTGLNQAQVDARIAASPTAARAKVAEDLALEEVRDGAERVVTGRRSWVSSTTTDGCEWNLSGGVLHIDNDGIGADNRCSVSNRTALIGVSVGELIFARWDDVGRNVALIAQVTSSGQNSLGTTQELGVEVLYQSQVFAAGDHVLFYEADYDEIDLDRLPSIPPSKLVGAPSTLTDISGLVDYVLDGHVVSAIDTALGDADWRHPGKLPLYNAETRPASGEFGELIVYQTTSEAHRRVWSTGATPPPGSFDARTAPAGFQQKVVPRNSGTFKGTLRGYQVAGGYERLAWAFLFHVLTGADRDAANWEDYDVFLMTRTYSSFVAVPGVTYAGLDVSGGAASYTSESLPFGNHNLGDVVAGIVRDSSGDARLYVLHPLAGFNQSYVESLADSRVTDISRAVFEVQKWDGAWSGLLEPGDVGTAEIADDAVTGRKLDYSGTRTDSNQHLTIAADGTLALGPGGGGEEALFASYNAVPFVVNQTNNSWHTLSSVAVTPGSATTRYVVEFLGQGHWQQASGGEMRWRLIEGVQSTTGDTGSCGSGCTVLQGASFPSVTTSDWKRFPIGLKTLDTPGVTTEQTYRVQAWFATSGQNGWAGLFTVEELP